MAPIVKSGNSWKNLLLPNSGNERLLDEEDIDFASDVYALAQITTDELLNSWKVFTALKDESYQGRRLENAAWRLQAMQKLGRPASSEATSKITGGRCGLKDMFEPAHAQQDTPATSETASEPEPEEGKELHPILDDSWAAKHLLGVCLKNKLSNETVREILQVIQDRDFRPSDLPSAPEQLRALHHSQRPVLAIFTHSLERNGANNFCLYIARLLKNNQPLTIFSPKAGPMQEDFEKLGLEVTIVDTTSPSFLEDLSTALLLRRVGLLLANTIMRCDIILMAAELKMPRVWVIHESWPQDQLDHYAKEVFMCKDINSTVIRKAFAAASRIVFPSDMQRHLYDGMFKPEAGLTVYNGIPLQQLDHFKQTQDRRQVRAALGYTDKDFLVLHLGTVCSRKGQVFSATACAKLIKENGCQNLKQLIVGARYIREHEIKYIDQIFQVASSYGLSCRRFEDLCPEELGQSDITIMDIQAAVLRFYMAADVVLVPSLNEVLPLVICESMAFERPVVCSKIDAIPEALTDGVEGFLVPAGNADAIRDAVLRLYQSPELRTQMGAAGRDRVLKQFSYGRMGERYRELLDNAPAPAEVLKSGILKGKTVLVDMDNTIVDWDGEFIRRYARFTDQDTAEIERLVGNRKHFEIEQNFDSSQHQKVLEVVASPGFYECLQPIPGAVEALHAMVAEGVDVKLVTAPHPSCAGNCAREKFISVERLFGTAFLERLIITRDKTHVQGDLLIDDKPRVTGSMRASWEHVLFSQSYNHGMEGKTRLSSWAEWADVLPRAF